MNYTAQRAPLAGAGASRRVRGGVRVRVGPVGESRGIRKKLLSLSSVLRDLWMDPLYVLPHFPHDRSRVSEPRQRFRFKLSFSSRVSSATRRPTRHEPR